MKRDIDLLRDILLQVEADGKPDIPKNHTDEEIADHVQQLLAAGLIDGDMISDRGGFGITGELLGSLLQDTTSWMPQGAQAFGRRQRAM